MKQGELVIRHEHVDVRRLVFDVMEMSEALLAAPVKLLAANVRMLAMSKVLAMIEANANLAD